MAEIKSHEEGELEKKVKKMKVHYRFIPFLHLDYIFSNLPIGKIAPFNQFHNFRKFGADVYEYGDDGKKNIGTITNPDKGEEYKDLYYRAMVSHPESDLKLDLEWASDTAQEANVNKEGRYDYDRLLSLYTANGQKPINTTQHSVDLLHGWWLFPYNLYRYATTKIGNLFRKKDKKVKEPVELGQLYDVSPGFVNGVDLVVDENLLYRVFTLGAKAYDVRDNDGMTLATIKRGWFKRLISFGWWQDYDIKIKYKEYETDEFKKYLVSLTDFVHMQSNIRNKKMPTVNPSDVLRGR